jgi:uncharacterized protein with NAD-binding domain and iron-sulfur cluster
MSKTVAIIGAGMAGLSADGALAFAPMSGRHVTQLLCTRDKKRFVTSTP